jgi:hypothetical protein
MRRRAVLALVALLGALGSSHAEEPLYHGPLDHAKVGQWVLYQMANDMRMKHSIVRVEGKSRITIKDEMWIKDKALPAMETTVDIEKRPDTGEKQPKVEPPKVEEGTLEVASHSFKCRIQTQQSMKTWFSDQIPVMGIVRQELDGKMTMEVAGYGQTDGEDLLKK